MMDVLKAINYFSVAVHPDRIGAVTFEFSKNKKTVVTNKTTFRAKTKN